MPIRLEYAKKIAEKKSAQKPVQKIIRKTRKSKDDIWVIMISGKQISGFFSTSDGCLGFIEEHNLSSQLPSIEKIGTRRIKCSTCGKSASAYSYEKNKLIYTCLSNHDTAI